MIQASSVVPVAVQMQVGVSIVTDQTVTPEAQDNQPLTVLLPDSREMDDPPPPYQAVATGYQTLQVDMPPSYEEAEHGHGHGHGEDVTSSTFRNIRLVARQYVKIKTKNK